MSVSIRSIVSLPLLLVLAACSADGTATPATSATVGPSAAARVEPEQVAERLLTQLRDQDYEAAYETLSTGQARDVAANGLDLMTSLQGADTLVEDWSLEEPSFISVDDQPKVEVLGTVTYEDGGTGDVRIVMEAIGLQADPWRIDEFELTRD